MTTLITISVGSTAAKFRWPDFPREPKDMDVFSNSPLPGEDAFWDDRLHDYFYHRGPGPVARFATPDELYTIKLSHTEWELRNGSWNKHMNDLLWMQQKGCQVDEQLYKLLRSIWIDRYGDRKFNLSDDKSKFFDDAVPRKYDHDSLHRSVAIMPGTSLYENFLKPGASVDMDMGKLWSVLDVDKQVVLDLFYEEIAVTALERKVIPSNFTASPAAAWAWATRRTITSLTKGRSSRFIRENYSFYRTASYDYIAQHKKNSHLLEELT
jgi:hypothetical protein